MRFGIKTTFDEMVTINAMRAETLRQLEGAEQRLTGKGIGLAFARAAKPDPMGDLGMLSGLIVHLILGSPFAASLSWHSSHPVLDHALVSAAVECLSGASEEAMRYRRATRSDDYPEGRRKCPLMQARVRPRFKLASEKKSAHVQRDAKMEVAFFQDLLARLEKLDRAGQKQIRVTGDVDSSLQRLVA